MTQMGYFAKELVYERTRTHPKIDQGYPQRRTFLFDAPYEAYNYSLASRARRWLPLKGFFLAL